MKKFLLCIVFLCALLLFFPHTGSYAATCKLTLEGAQMLHPDATGTPPSIFDYVDSTTNASTPSCQFDKTKPYTLIAYGASSYTDVRGTSNYFNTSSTSVLSNMKLQVPIDLTDQVEPGLSNKTLGQEYTGQNLHLLICQGTIQDKDTCIKNTLGIVDIAISTAAPSPQPTSTPAPQSIAGYCTWDPNTQAFDNHCNTSSLYVPVTNPTGGCACRLAGSAGTFGIQEPTLTPTPSSTPPPPQIFPCASIESGTNQCQAIASGLGINITTDPLQFINLIFTVLLSMSGGWAVYLIITAGYQLMFSNGDAEGVKEAQEKISSAIVGIVFMVLSFIILRIIGVDIFQLPTFHP